MAMHNPPHPGEFIQATYMEPFDSSCRYLAAKLDVAASTLNRVIKMQSGISCIFCSNVNTDSGAS